MKPTWVTPLPGPAMAVRDMPAELITRAAAGDRAAVQEILTVVQPLVARYCRARISRPAADDATRDACRAVLRSLPHYRLTGPFLGWVYRIAANTVTAADRATCPQADLVAVTGVADGRDTISGEIPERAARCAEQASALGDLLAELPERHREVLILRIIWCLPTAEIAEVLGCSEDAIRVDQHCALAALRRRVGAHT